MSYALSVISTDSEARRAHYKAVIEQWSNSLYELDEHATYRLLAAGDMYGVTGDRANETVASAPILWGWLGRLRDQIETVDQLIEETTMFTSHAGEIHQLLTGDTISITLATVPDGLPATVHSRLVDADGDPATYETNCDGLIELFRAVYEPVRDIVAEVDAVWSDLMPRIEAATLTLDRANALCDRLDVSVPEVKMASQRLAAVRASVSDDPLSLSGNVGPDLDKLVAAAARASGALAHAHGSLGEDLARADKLIAELRVLRARAAAAYSKAEAKVIPVGGLIRVPSTAVIDGRNGLAHRARRFAELGDGDDWREARAVVDEWMTAAERLRSQLEKALRVNDAPLSERADLRGLLRAYRVKASMISDLPQEVTDIGQQAHDELFISPTDLGRAKDLMERFAAELTTYGGRS